jgi:hypothetical protein
MSADQPRRRSSIAGAVRSMGPKPIAGVTCQIAATTGKTLFIHKSLLENVLYIPKKLIAPWFKLT